MPSETRRDRVERVEGLLASVQDLVASLTKLGSELEHEIAQVLYENRSADGFAQDTLELENTRLKIALEGRAVIEQAKGILIAGRCGTAEDAFAVLTRIARESGRPIRDVAAGIVRSGTRPRDDDPQTQPSVAAPSAPSEAAPADAAPADAAPADSGEPAEEAPADAPPSDHPVLEEPVSEQTGEIARPILTGDVWRASINLDTVIESSAPGGDDPARRRWRPLNPSHSSSRRGAPRFRDSGS